MSGLTVAIDAGTTFIKAVLLDEGGAELAVASRPTTVLRPRPECSEQDMAEVRSATLDCIAEVAAGAPRAIARVVITAQGDGAWLVDADGQPAGPAILWNDARATDVLAEWSADGLLGQAFRINGSFGNLGLPHTILAWLHRHDPDRLRSVRSVLTCGGWLLLSLTGRIGLHPSDASAPWLDADTGLVSDRLLELYGIPWARDLVPPVLLGAAQTSPLLPAVAAAVGLPAGIPVTIAPYDVVSTANGSGAVAVGDAFCILGTTLCSGVLVAAPDTSGEPSGLTLLGEPGSPVARAFPTLAGTGVVDWAAGLLGLGGAAEVTRLAADAAPGSHGVRVWPYLSPAGERAPFLDSAARGVIGGITLDTTRADFALAVIEGLAHVIQDCLDAAGSSPTSLSLAGGGSASDLWCQTIADVTGVVTVRPSGTQLGARGALMSALVSEGEAPDLLTAAARLLTTPASFEPRAEAHALAGARHEDFLDTRSALTPRWTGWRTSP